MKRVLLNAMASTAGGGTTYLRNVLPRLAGKSGKEIIPPDLFFHLLVPPEHLQGYLQFAGPRIIIETAPVSGGILSRWWWEQTRLRGYLREHQIDVLISLGNFALFHSPVTQILFNRNALYFSDDFKRDLISRKQYGMLLGHLLKSRLAKASIRQADINVTPTIAFANLISEDRSLRECRFEVLPFGFDPSIFQAGDANPDQDSDAKIDLGENCCRVLYVSHYNYFRNFETLIHSLPEMKQKIREMTGKRLQLLLTTDLKRGAVYGGYDSTSAAEMIDRMGVRNDIVMLGNVPYQNLHTIYRLADLFVCPSYAESFGHPLLEAMASGVPVVAANLPVHREICEEAAIYFDVFNPVDLAQKCASLLSDANLKASLKERGKNQAAKFTWDIHVNKLCQLIERC